MVVAIKDCGKPCVNEHKVFSEHPVTKKPVYFFADIPHLLKLLRNWFLDTGFVLQDNTVINKNPVKSLLENTRSEINSCFKLTPLHLNCERSQRQNVKLAAQLFSNTTATALKHYLPGEDNKASAATGDFVDILSVQYILTHRLNQDCLENFFSQVSFKI